MVPRSTSLGRWLRPRGARAPRHIGTALESTAWLARSGDGFRSGSYPFQPEGHVHLAVHRCRVGEILASVVPLAPALARITETPVTVSDEGAHAPRSGEGQRLTVVGLGGGGVT